MHEFFSPNYHLPPAIYQLPFAIHHRPTPIVTMSIDHRDLVCWKCGAPFGDTPLPLSRFAECKACHAPLHVCRQCEFYDISVANACREPIADAVKDKTRANFCAYLRPHPGAFVAADGAASGKARSELEALFGITQGATPSIPTGTDAARVALDKLFKGGG